LRGKWIEWEEIRSRVDSGVSDLDLGIALEEFGFERWGNRYLLK
jgi:hypothetical protein